MPRRVQRTSFLGFGILVALVTAGCGSTTMPTDGSPSAAPSPTTAATRAAAPTSAATAEPTDLVVGPLPESGHTMFAGRYTTHFMPALELTIDRQVRIDCAPGYQCRGDVDVNSANWLDIEFGRDHPIEMMVMRFDRLYDPTHAGALIDPPSDLTAWVAAMPEVTVTGQETVQVGGVTGTQLDLDTGSQEVVFGPTGLSDPPAFGLGAHGLRRLILLQVSGEVVIIALAPVLPEDNTEGQLRAAVSMLRPIVDSIVWQ